jgi:hypothetical protein
MLQGPYGIGHDPFFTSADHYLKGASGGSFRRSEHQTTNHQIERLLISNWRPRSIRFEIAQLQ